MYDMIPSGFHVGGRDDSVRLPCWRPRTALSSDIARGRRHLTTQLLGRLGSRLNQHPPLFATPARAPGCASCSPGRETRWRRTSSPPTTSLPGGPPSAASAGAALACPSRVLRGSSGCGGPGPWWHKGAKPPPGKAVAESRCKDWLQALEQKMATHTQHEFAHGHRPCQSFVLSFTFGVWSRRPQS